MGFWFFNLNAKKNKEKDEKKEELLLESLNREIETNKKIKTNKREIGGFSFDFVWDRHNLNHDYLSINDIENAKKIDEFKYGKYSKYFSNLFSNIIEDKCNEKKDFIIMPIPCSVQPIRDTGIPADNEERMFKNVLNLISDQTKIENGFDYIRVNPDNRKCDESLRCLGYVVKDYIIVVEKIKGKKIVLLDACITSGIRFITLANKLKSLGASSVEGLFLSRTYHHSNEILEANQKDNTEKKC